MRQTSQLHTIRYVYYYYIKLVFRNWRPQTTYLFEIQFPQLIAAVANLVTAVLPIAAILLGLAYYIFYLFILLI